MWPVRHLLETRFTVILNFVPVYESSIATASQGDGARRAMALPGSHARLSPMILRNGRLVRAAEERADIPLGIKIYRYEPE